MSMENLVSVVIPTFNREKVVCRAINSALNQTHSNIEVILVDDGSTDCTPELIARAYKNEPRLKYIRTANGGVSRARNTGIKASAGDYVAFLDSDDYWIPWKIEAQVKCLELLPQAGMIWSDMDSVDDNGTLLHERYLRRMYSAYERISDLGLNLFSAEHSISTTSMGVKDLPNHLRLFEGNIFSPMVIGNLVHTSTCLLRRSRLEKIGGFREDLQVTGEDYDFHLRTCREGAVAYLDTQTICYTVGRSDQLTAPSLSVYMAKNYLRTLELVLAESRNLIELPDKEIEEILIRAHQWVANTALHAGSRSDAWQHAIKCICVRPFRPTPYVTCCASLIPRLWFVLLCGYRRTAKQVIRKIFIAEKRIGPAGLH